MIRAWRSRPPALGIVAATFFLLLTTLTAQPTPFDICPGPNDVFVNAGGENEYNIPPGTSVGYRCDNATYVTSSASWEYTTPENVALTGNCTNQYLSHRVAGASSDVLEYTIPVDAGSYTVHLMFMETFWMEAGKREFTASVNGQFIQPNGVNNTIDLFLLGGKNVPLIYTVPNVTVDSATAATSGIVIQVNRLPMMDNPMLSGFAILGLDGATANSVVGSTNVAGCGLNSLPATSALPSLSPTPSGSFGAIPSPSTSASASVGAVPPSPSVSAPPTPLPSPINLTPTTLCPGPGDVFINAGGFNTASGFRCDNATYVTSSSSWEYTTPEQVALSGPCTEHYLTHRVAGAASDVLEYTIPVPPGMYTVYLMFMETFWMEAGKREFNASVNGNFIQPNGVNETVDLYALAGKNVPFFVTVENIVVTATSQQIVVQANRLLMMDNPIISAIGIQGKDGTAANGLIGFKGLNGCGDAEPLPAPPSALPTPSDSLISAVPTAEVDVCPGLADVFFNTGGPLAGEWRCDVGVVSQGTAIYSVPSAGLVDQGCRDHYLSHRLTFGTGFTYTVPVSEGTYNVYLMFMETFFTGPNLRTFSIDINGAPIVHPAVTDGVLDVYAAAGGMNKELLLNITGVSATENIVISLSKIVENPMISGFAIVGDGATDVLKTSYIDSCDALPVPVDCTNQGSFTDAVDAGHVAHAQAGGPYVETDFNMDLKAKVQLDALQSHSHASAPQFAGNGAITNYKWTWTDASNPDADAGGVVTVLGATPAPEFPLGTTNIELEVNDQFCNKAKEATTVTVNSATVPGAYCYLYDFMQSSTTSVPLPFNVLDEPKPQFGWAAGLIDIGATTLTNFNFNFKDNSYGVRCIFSVEVTADATLQYQIVHSGPLVAYQGTEALAISNSTITDTITTTASKFFAAGTYDWQIIYFRNADVAPQLSFQFATNGQVVPQNIVRHDASTTLPVITSLTPSAALATEIVTIFGSAFVNGVNVKFGDVAAEQIISTPGSLQVRVPPKQGLEEVVGVVVETLAGVSNKFQFVYGSTTDSCQVISFTETSLKQNGVDFGINNIAVVKYGPDGRMYLGSTQSLLHVLELSVDLVVTSNIPPKNVKTTPSEPNRWVLGIAFNPATYNPLAPSLKLYFSTSTMYWAHNPPQFSDTEGWKNGKVQSITVQANGGYNNDVTDVVTGLPVTDHDHGVNFLQFLPNGKLIIAVGGFTNGGISVVGDGLGGIPAPDYAGALIECDTATAPNVITYAENAKLSTNKSVVSSGSCTEYAVGLRNTFAGELHTNNELYVTDNGPNTDFGAFSTNCEGGQVPDKNNPDKLHKIVPGACHGHPHLLRGQTNGEQCVFNSGACVQPLADTLESSTNGVLEYRSNWFVGKLKGNLLLSKFSLGPGKQGAITRVQLDPKTGNLPNTQTKGITQLFQDDSGLSIVEGPRGEVIMSRVFKNSFLVLKPICVGGVTNQYFIGVHPRRGPAAGGQLVTISGFNFGTMPTVLFGTAPCTEVNVISTETITCKTPPYVAGEQVKVTVSDEVNGEAIATTGADFWYW